MVKIKEICGGAISIKLDKEIEIEKLIAIFNDYDVVYKSKDSLKLKKDKKEMLVFKYGEILLYNFDKNEINLIIEKMQNV
ncbi:MAG: hypothetical protein QW367_01720 [Candidatus Aenigmatarchaeota archaeon]